MAIQETQVEMKKNAQSLAQDASLSKHDVKKVISKKAPSKAKLTIASKKSVPTVAKKKTASAVVSGSGYWVQVASLPTQASAHKEAKRLQGKSAKELKVQKYRTVRVDLGKPKGVRYRVHFGPLSKSQAVQKCKNLKGNEKISCLVVKG